MANAIDSLNFNSTDYVFTLPYGTCATAAATAAKVVTLDNFSLETGASVRIKFTYANTVSSPTLNINNTGAKSIFWHGATLASSQYWQASAVLDFVYNGTQWDMIGVATDNNTTYGAAGSSLGLVKSGGDVTISSGTITVNDDSHNHVIENVDGLQDALDGKVDLTSAQTISGSKTFTKDTSFDKTIILGECVMLEGGYVNDAPQVDFWGYNGDEYTRLANIEEPKDAHDAANKKYVDNSIAAGSPYLKDCEMSENRIYASTYSDELYAVYENQISSLACFSSVLYDDDSTGNTYSIIVPASPEAVLEWINSVGRYYSNSTNGEIFNNYYDNKASGAYSHAEGNTTTASGGYSHAEGNTTTASGACSHAEGYKTTALNYQHAQGHYNNQTNADEGVFSGTSSGTAFVIGNGTSTSPSNAFRVDYNGKPYCKSAVTTSGCDYAEYFEWKDANINAEDRRGYFVTLDEDKIKIAEPNDYILGIISGHPSVIGNGDEDWMGRYVFDDFGEFVYEEFEYDEEESVEVVDKETGETKTEMKTVKKTGTKYKENPNYDPAIPYIQREDRPEWDAVGMLGVLSVRDDGTCKVNGYCKVADGGIATAADSGYRVIKRVSDNVVKVVFK